MNNRIVIFVMLVILASSFFFMVGSCSQMISGVGSMAGASSMVPSEDSPLGLVKVEGALMNPQPILNQLKKLSEDSDIKGILLRINSPGGAVGAAQEIMNFVARLEADSLPVVVSFGNVAASGGYYIALPGRKIFTNPGTLTGSIGVISQFPQGQELLDKIGVGMVTVKSGELKDAGSVFRKPTDKELSYLQDVIDGTYEQFLEHVNRYREVDSDTLIKYTDGRVFTGKTAVALGFADTLGGMQEAVEYLSEAAGLSRVPKKLKEIKPVKTFWKEILDEPVSELRQTLEGKGSRLLYMMP